MKRFCFLVLLGLPGAFLAQESEKAAPPESQHLSAFEKDKIVQGQLSLRYAENLIAAGQTIRARQLLEDLIVLYPFHPDNATMLTLLGDLASRRGALEDALVWYRRAYLEGRNKEKASRAFLKAGELASEMGETRLAEEIFLELAKERKYEDIGRDAENRLKALRVLDLPDGPARSASGDGL